MMLRRFSDRAVDLLLSIYLYNEYQGYTQIGLLIRQLENGRGFGKEFLEAVRKHQADERKHYFMFIDYFEHEGRMPFSVGRSIGHFDILVKALTGEWTWEHDRHVLTQPKQFAPIARAIVTTEIRGLKQVRSLLKSRAIKSRPHLARIFAVIERDEPSHFLPYQKWLNDQKLRPPGPREAFFDKVIHYGIAMILAPILYFNFALPRLEKYPHQREVRPLTSPAFSWS